MDKDDSGREGKKITLPVEKAMRRQQSPQQQMGGKHREREGEKKSTG